MSSGLVLGLILICFFRPGLIMTWLNLVQFSLCDFKSIALILVLVCSPWSVVLVWSGPGLSSCIVSYFPESPVGSWWGSDWWSWSLWSVDTDSVWIWTGSDPGSCCSSRRHPDPRPGPGACPGPPRLPADETRQREHSIIHSKITLEDDTSALVQKRSLVPVWDRYTGPESDWREQSLNGTNTPG